MAHNVVDISSDSDDDDVVVRSPSGHLKQRLANQLDELQSAGDFASLKRYNVFSNPGLEVGGTLYPLPLTPRDAELLKGVCTQAPFGRGDETVVDESVRKTWELHSSKFKLVNPAWPTTMTMISKDAQEALGMTTVSIEPYKLLLYEEGSFFKRHKDSEKVPGMIGTLVICLPSKHEGGDVLLSFGDKQRRLATSCTSAFDLTAMAWYSDVTHEITKLTSGYRLILLYNIIQSGSHNASPTIMVSQQDALSITLTDLRKESPNTKRYLYPLEHKYTPSSLSVRYIKGRDRAVCHTLEQIASKHGFFLLLANMTRHEDYEDYCDEGEDRITLERINTFGGEEVTSDLNVELADIIGPDPYKSRDADSEDEGEFTGNENMPSSFRYHNTVVMLGPKEHLDQLVHRIASVGPVLKLVEEDLNKDAPNHTAQQYAVPLMEKILSLPDKIKATGYGQTLLPAGYSGFNLPENDINIEDLSTIAKWAIKLQAKQLYEKVVCRFIQLKAAHVITELVSKPINEDFVKSSSVPVWEDWLGAFIKASPNMDDLTNLLDSVRLRLCHEELRQSMQAWQALREEEELFRKPSFTPSDLDFISRLVESRLSDDDWIQNKLLPNLGERGDKFVLASLVIRLLGQTGPGSKASTVGEFILAVHSSKLELRILDFPQYAAGWHFQGRFTTQPPEKSDSYPDQFLHLISRCLQFGQEEAALTLLTSSCSEMLGCLDTWPAALQPLNEFLLAFPTIFEVNEQDAPPIAKELWVSLFRRYVVGTIPVLPLQLRGQAHKRRGCGHPGCADCARLDAFLQSETETTFVLSVNASRRRHVADRLPRTLFQHQIDTSRRAGSGGCHTLIITKLGQEHKEDLDRYNRQVAELKQNTRPFIGDSIKAFMGEALYNELVHFSHLPQPEPHRDMSVSQKRGPSDAWEQSSARRPW